MWLKRIGAVAAAVVLIAGALLIRDALDGDDDEPTVASGSEPTTAPTTPSSPDVIVCAEELGLVCGSLAAAWPGAEVRVEPAYVTLDALAAEGAEPVLWVTMSPFPGMVDAQRQTTGDDPLALATTPVGRTPLKAASPNDGRLSAVEAACAGEPLWRCIGDLAGTAWSELGATASGDVSPSVGDVESSGLALVALSGAVAGFFNEPSFASSSLQDPSFLAWLRKLATAVPANALSGTTPLATMAVRPAVNVASTTDAELASVSADPSPFEVKYPDPTMGVEGVVAGPVPDAALLFTIESAFTGNGWEPAAASPAAAPSAITMLGLRQLWSEATR